MREYALASLISTDPPYYDNVSIRGPVRLLLRLACGGILGEVWPDECATLLTPKSGEIIADPDRHGWFETAGLRSSLRVGNGRVHGGSRTVVSAADVPATIYYAYKATETKDGENPFNRMGHVPARGS